MATQLSKSQREEVERSIARALSNVDALWNERELAALYDRNGSRALDVLRELVVNELASQSFLQLHPERFEAILDAQRMGG